MNEISIIINGVRYDAVSILPHPIYPICSQCHFNEICESKYQSLPDLCNEFLEPEQVFKKSNYDTRKN